MGEMLDIKPPSTNNQKISCWGEFSFRISVVTRKDLVVFQPEKTKVLFEDRNG